MAQRSISETLTGAVVLVVALGFLGYAVANTGRGPVSGYTLHADFDHIDGLVVGSDVRVAGVKVGSVTATRIDPSSFQAEVAFTVQDALKLPSDSSAAVVSDGLLGGKYLQLVPGGDEKLLAPGGTITVTQSAVNIEQLLGNFIFSMGNLSNQKPNQGAPQGESQPAPQGAPLGAPK